MSVLCSMRVKRINEHEKSNKNILFKSFMHIMCSLLNLEHFYVKNYEHKEFVHMVLFLNACLEFTLCLWNTSYYLGKDCLPMQI